LFITRIIKEAEVRRTELMDAALELFRFVGYQKTMIIDITKKTGAAKGTFYHYFPSKEAILEAICARWATEMATSFKLENRQLTALPKLQLFITRLFLPTQLNILFKRLWDEEQLNLYYKAWKKLVEDVFNPLITDMIQQGDQEKTMRVVSIKEAIAFFWSTLSCIWEALFFQEPPEVIATKVKLAESLLERVLGIEEGAFKITLTSYEIA
ncbi:MAG: yfiR, partial [Sporomusa sp.]|nr:yfiR [Sporomusa sp.]